MTLSRRELLIAAAAATAPRIFAAPARHREPFRGVFIIMQTPFLSDSAKSIDEASLARESDFLCRCGVHGMVWPALAGETDQLTHDERMRYPGTIIQAARGRVPVAIGVHGKTNEKAVEFARNAVKLGADALIALGRRDDTKDTRELEAYYTAIASVSKLPVIIQVSNEAMTVDFNIGLAKKLPTVRYVKEENSPVPWLVTRYRKEAKGLLTVSTGGGARNFMNEMARGSDGTMPGAGFADIQAQIWDWYQAGKKKEARELFAKMLMMAVLEQHTGYMVQKEILKRRGVFSTTVMRSPRKMGMDEWDQRELTEIFDVLRPYFRMK
ncbi:MAG: dihydrodipicolinate synthase family protein [Acidobacteriales bacterium]|nr:dihydrodipicolinate synthase family protein [Terriglobales bacterium]